MQYFSILMVLFIFCVTGCRPLNTPYPNDAIESNTLYSSFNIRPKHLDPAKAYSSDEYLFIGQIYEPPLQYHFKERPYKLIPLTASKVPEATQQIIDGVERTVYDIHIRPNIYYEPHPAFTEKRELIAADYVYQLKRIAAPHIQSPIHALMGKHIVGFTEFANNVKQTSDLAQNNLAGVSLVSRYHYKIILNQPYPQFVYWLALPFFSPMPAEVITWHESPERGKDHPGIDWYPIGTGAYRLSKNDPNQEMILTKNPNYRTVYAPDSQEKLPFVDRVVFKLEKEAIPYWQKFLQGYYDASGVGSDQFDQALRVTDSGAFQLSQSMQDQGIQLVSATHPSLYYMGFNMLDETLGGYTQKQQALRQAIAIAVDYEEMISIFANGRGLVAQSPIPPGVFGHLEGEAGLNPITHHWQDGRALRRPISDAQALLKKAGYPNGIDAKTGEKLTLYFDTASNSVDGRARLNWIRKQFAKLNIDLVVRSTDYNRFREKIKTGNAQIFEWGWNADYPDPENFLFLLNGANGKVKYQGENASNYANPTFDFLFERMRDLPNGAERLAIIEEMLNIARQDVPWLWGWNRLSIALYHPWVSNIKPNAMAHNTQQYRKLDPVLRAQKRTEQNEPILFPLIFVVMIVLLLVFISIYKYRQRLNHRIKRPQS